MVYFRLLPLFWLLLLAGGLTFPSQVRAQDLELKNMALDNVSGSIQLSYGIQVLEVQALEEHLSEGLVLRLQCRAKLIRDRRWWWDALLQEEQQEFQLRTQRLQGKYVLSSKQQDKALKGKDLGQLLQRGWSGMKLRLGKWEQLEPEQDYAVVIKLSLKRSNVPWWLRKALFFWSWDVVPEQKYRMDFKY